MSELDVIRAFLRAGCAEAAPDLDADAFADAVIELARAQRELGADDVVDVFGGALEVAERRAETHPDQEDR